MKSQEKPVLALVLAVVGLGLALPARGDEWADRVRASCCPRCGQPMFRHTVPVSTPLGFPAPFPPPAPSFMAPPTMSAAPQAVPYAPQPAPGAPPAAPPAAPPPPEAAAPPPPQPPAPIAPQPAPGAPPAAPPAAPPPPEAAAPPPPQPPFYSAAEPAGALSRGGPPGSLSPYIDSAVPRSRVRVRYDAAWFDNRPNRAEFFWPQKGPFRAAGQPVRYQEQSTYVEYAPLPNMSAFIDVPTRFVHIPGVFGRQKSQNFSGFSDLRLGVKYAFLTDPNYFYTFMLRTYLPTGNGASGLGTAHASLEPGLLAFQRLSERLYFVGEFTDWIPLHGSVVSRGPGQPFAGRHFAGNTLTYGGGLIYNLVLTDRFRLAPTTEVVGWTVLGGLEGIGPGRFQSAAGDTIVNYKIGATLGLGDYLHPGGATPLNDRLSLYAGYSRSLTGDVWARDTFRLELVWYYGQRRRRPG